MVSGEWWVLSACPDSYHRGWVAGLDFLNSWIIFDGMKCLIISFLLLPLVVFSQSASFTHMKRKPFPEKYNVDSATIVYPIVVLGNKTAMDRINKAIRAKILDGYTEDSTLSLDSSLRIAAEDGLIVLSYEKEFNQRGLLSLNFYSEYVAAYVSVHEQTLNFDLKTGKELTVQDLFTPAGLKSFTALVKKEKKAALVKYKRELNGDEVGKDEYKWAMEQVNEYCLNSVSLDEFIITPSEIIVLDKCEFPHVIQALGPTYELRYKIKSIKSWLKPERAKQLTQ